MAAYTRARALEGRPFRTGAAAPERRPGIASAAHRARALTFGVAVLAVSRSASSPGAATPHSLQPCSLRLCGVINPCGHHRRCAARPDEPVTLV